MELVRKITTAVLIIGVIASNPVNGSVIGDPECYYKGKIVAIKTQPEFKITEIIGKGCASIRIKKNQKYQFSEPVIELVNKGDVIKGSVVKGSSMTPNGPVSWRHWKFIKKY